MGENIRFLEEISIDDVSSHIYELYVDSSNSRSKDLGIISKNQKIKLTIDNTDHEFEQSISQLNNSKSSTGFVLWRVSVPFIEWLMNCKLYDFNDKYVVEMGAGVTGIFSTIIGKLTKHYIATDQKHLLKLLRKNIMDNNDNFESKTIDVIVSKQKKKQILKKIDVCEYDWENCEEDLQLIKQLNTNDPDFIIGCDIVYNDYLVPYLVDAIDRLAGINTKILIGLQLRLPENIEMFVEELLKKEFRVFRHEESVLTEELKQGYVIYYIERSLSNNRQ